MIGKLDKCLESLPATLIYVSNRYFVVTSHRFRGGAGNDGTSGGRDRRNFSVNLNLGGARRTTRMPSNYNEFLGDVVNRVQGLRNESNRGPLNVNRNEEPRYNVYVNLTGAGQQQPVNAFDPLTVYEAVNTSRCTERRRSLPQNTGRAALNAPSPAPQYSDRLRRAMTGVVRSRTLEAEARGQTLTPRGSDQRIYRIRSAATPYTNTRRNTMCHLPMINEEPNQGGVLNRTFTTNEGLQREELPVVDTRTYEEQFGESIAPYCVIPYPVPFADFFSRISDMIREGYRRYFGGPPQLTDVQAERARQQLAQGYDGRTVPWGMDWSDAADCEGYGEFREAQLRHLQG